VGGEVWLSVGQNLVLGRFVGCWMVGWGQLMCGTWYQLKLSAIPFDNTIVVGFGFVLGVLSFVDIGYHCWIGLNGRK